MVIDVHCHIIPGIDDGAKDKDIALEMCRIAQMEGTNGIIATPHYIHGAINNTSDVINEKVAELNSWLKEHNIELEIYPGCEVFIFPELPRLVREGHICTLNNSRYILIELPMNSVPEYTKDVIYELKLSGFTPIIAHPERNSAISKDPNILHDFIIRGALAQVNATSLKGLFGKDVRDKAVELMRHNMVHLLASDAHTAGGRSPKLSRAMDVIEQKVGPEALLQIMKNGEAVLKNQTILIEDPINTKGNDMRMFGSFKKLVSNLL